MSNGTEVRRSLPSQSTPKAASHANTPGRATAMLMPSTPHVVVHRSTAALSAFASSSSTALFSGVQTSVISVVAGAGPMEEGTTGSVIGARLIVTVGAAATLERSKVGRRGA